MIQKNIIRFLFLLTILTQLTFCEYKIVYLISPPRSLSTAFLRMIEARNDFIIINEPSIRINDAKNNSRYYEDTLKSVTDMKEKIFTESKQSNVFIKEISRSVSNFLTNDQDLRENENVYFVFLVRNPHHSIISFYKKLPTCFHNFSDFVGYKFTYEILKLTQTQYFNKPLIICSEDLYQNPEKTIENFCNHIGIENKPEALQWQDLGEDFTGIDEWHETKQKLQAHHWHGDAIRSSGFKTPRTYITDEKGIPTFEEITNTKDRETCQRAYYENLKYYQLILNEITSI